jgi:hypothetical protein
MRQGIRVTGGRVFVTLAIVATATVAVVGATITSVSTSALTPSASTAEVASLKVEQISEASPDLSGFAPGDRTEWAAVVTNTGEPGTLNVQLAARGDRALVSEEGSALQMFVDLCTTELLPSVSGLGVTTFECASGETRIGSATSADARPIAANGIMDTGETVSVRVLVLFPTSATNTAENSSAELDVAFSLSTDNDTGIDRADPITAVATLPGMGPLFMTLTAAALLALGLLLLIHALRPTSTEGDEIS